MRAATILGLVAAAVTPWAADRLRTGTGRCELDGARIDAAFRVRIVRPDGGSVLLCSVTCAENWLRRRGEAPRDVRVTDAPSGREIDARAATFARIPTARGEGPPDWIQAFESEAEAELRVKQYGGEILDGKRRPF